MHRRKIRFPPEHPIAVLAQAHPQKDSPPAAIRSFDQIGMAQILDRMIDVLMR
ncbi:hypothetical protein D3C73_1460740 [compost metagenome]